MPEQIAKVAVENAAFSFDDAFDYAIPAPLMNRVRPGVRVLVPFGKGSRRRQGLVFALRDKKEASKPLKSISEVLDEAPLLNAELLRLAVFLKTHTFCTLFEAAKAMLPSGIGLHFVLSYLANPELIAEAAEPDMTDKQRQVYRHLKEQGVYVRRDRVLQALGLRTDDDVLEQMTKKGWLLCNTDLQRRVGDATVKMACLSEAYCNGELACKLTKKQKEVVSLLETAGSASVKEICYFSGVTAAVITSLTAKGVVLQYQTETFRRPQTASAQQDLARAQIRLTDEQRRAYDGLLSQMRQENPGTALLYGVTGSGKTQIYMRLLDACLEAGRTAIIMVPEISLTPQMLSLFYARYGETVAVFHSALSMGERLDEWKRVKRGEAKIALGTRSAVFAPLENIGLVVLDEEQEHTYKSEMTPRYHARDVAQFRAAEHRALVLLASATPSLESYSRAKSGRYALYTLDNRFGKAVLPKVETIPMSLGNDDLLSEALRGEIQATLDAGEQAILLLNRRGYNTFAACSACGKVMTCPHCSISLTYHARNHRLMCHYCGYSEPFTDLCRHCGEKQVRFSGSGTQRLEDALSAAFPQARLLRLDTDAAASRVSFENALKKFTNFEYDIMVGTQMVAKGLDFPNVTLVGVVSIDQMLYNDDYKSAERTFDLLTQVVGRAGRGEKPGRALIQTAFPDNEIIRLASRQDFPAFYELEIRIRQTMVYPPYCDICVFGFTGSDEMRTRAGAQAFLERLKTLHGEQFSDLQIIVLGPIAPRLARVAGKYRFRVLLKGRNGRRFRAFVSTLLKDFAKQTAFSRSVTVTADLNPESIY